MSRQYQPQGRYGHVAVGYRDKVFVWGGRTKKYSDSYKSKLASTLDAFDLRTELWERIEAKGAPPSGLIHCAFASDGPRVYVYGGGDGETDYDTLHCLNLHDLTWTKLPNVGGSGMVGTTPGRKNGARMVLWLKKLVLFGGYGDLPLTLPPTAIADDVPRRGLNNELHLYSISEDGIGTWSFQPSQSVPPPCSHFSFVDIGQGRVAKFGGKEQTGRTDALYILSLYSWTWSRVSGLFASPGSKAAHTISYLSGEQPSLLVSGGLSNGDQVSDEAWLFDLGTYTWTKAAKSDLLKRYWHTSTSFLISSSHVRVVLFGGISKVLRNGETFSKSSSIQNTIVSDLRLTQSKPDSPAEWTSVFESNLSTKERLVTNMKLFDSFPMSMDVALEESREERTFLPGLHISSCSEMESNTTLCNAGTYASIHPAQSIAEDSMIVNGRLEEDRKIEEDAKAVEEVLRPQNWALSEAERRAVEAERRAEAAEMRAVEAEIRATRAEGKAADVEKWSCVLQAAMDSAMDRVKHWEKRALRAEQMLAMTSLSAAGQRPASLKTAKSPCDSSVQDSDQLSNGVVVMEDRSNCIISAAGMHGPRRASAHEGGTVVERRCTSVEQTNATEEHTTDISNGMKARDRTGTAIVGNDVQNGSTSTNGQPNAMEERDNGDDEVLRSDSPQPCCATPPALQFTEATML